MRRRRAFGYGSLVNERTQGFGGTAQVLEGWRRVWVTTAARPAAFLSVERADAQIDGLIFDVPEDAWPELDRRETHYDPIPFGEGDIVYSVPSRNQTTGAAPILRSYLDVVLQGFHDVVGPNGLTRFMGTTTSWERGIFDDRAAPLYPRAQVISPEETRLFDALLASVPKIEELK